MKKTKICFAASSGGHFEQISMLRPLMSKYESFVVTEHTEYKATIKDEKMYYVHQVNRKEMSFPFWMVVNALKSIIIFLREKPDVVITTGVLARIPLCLLAFTRVEERMIFITLGSQKFQFNRLLKAVDELVAAGKIKDEVFAQIGYSDYKPMNYKYEQFLDREKFSQVMDKAEIVITHGGTGAIIGAVKKGKKVIAVPRLAKYGEHVDNHQLQLVGQFKELNLICECQDCAKLEEAIQTVKSTTYNKYKSNTQVIIDDITKFIEDEKR